MSADEMCGDYPAPCNCDAPETHDGAVDPDRPSVTDNARDEEPLAWCPGCGDRILTRVVRERGVCSDCWGTRDDPWAAGRAETTTGAIARGEALAAGDPDWMNVTRWPRTEAEATTTILRLIAENRRLTDIENGWRHDRSEWEAERDALAAKVAAVEALADETERAGDPLLRLDRLRAALSAAPTDTTKETGR